MSTSLLLLMNDSVRSEVDGVADYDSNAINTTRDFRDDGSVFDPLSYPFTATILVVVATSLTTIFIIINNLLILAAFNMEEALRTPNNYFLVSLASADLLIGSISMPLSTIYFIMKDWPFSHLTCDIYNTLDWSVCNVAQLAVFVLAVDRCNRVRRPDEYRMWLTHTKALVLISFNWISPFVVFVPLILVYEKVVSRYRIPGVCDVEFLLNPNHVVIFSVFYFWVPFTLLCILYGQVLCMPQRPREDVKMNVSRSEMIRAVRNLVRMRAAQQRQHSVRLRRFRAAPSLTKSQGENVKDASMVTISSANKNKNNCMHCLAFNASIVDWRGVEEVRCLCCGTDGVVESGDSVLQGICTEGANSSAVDGRVTKVDSTTNVVGCGDIYFGADAAAAVTEVFNISERDMTKTSEVIPLNLFNTSEHSLFRLETSVNTNTSTCATSMENCNRLEYPSMKSRDMPEYTENTHKHEGEEAVAAVNREIHSNHCINLYGLNRSKTCVTDTNNNATKSVASDPRSSKVSKGEGSERNNISVPPRLTLQSSKDTATADSRPSSDRSGDKVSVNTPSLDTNKERPSSSLSDKRGEDSVMDPDCYGCEALTRGKAAIGVVFSTPRMCPQGLGQSLKSTRKIAFILVAFAVCWGPYHLMAILYAYVATTADLPNYIFHMTYVLCYLSGAVNPFIYAYDIPLYKKTVIRLLRCDLRRNVQPVTELSFDDASMI